MSLLLCLAHPAWAGERTSALLDEATIAGLASEISGATAKRHLEFLARLHRMRASAGFREAAEYLAASLKKANLEQVELNEFPVDGEIFYGTQRSRPECVVRGAELWELAERDGEWVARERIVNWDASPIGLAQDSESGQDFAELVDVGDGTREADYEGKDVRGKLVLAAAQPGGVAPLAVDRFGAVGILSYAQNQKTAWWKEDETLVRWGHLGSFRENPTYAFMISLQRARAYQERLAKGETIKFAASVDAEKRAGNYTVLTAAIRGSDPQLAEQEIVFSCHLDHQRPGANDNASGSVALFEIARSLKRLIDGGRIEPPKRTLRFVWPPEIEGTMALLASRPEWAERIRAAIHLDMVGGGPETKAVFHVTRGPESVPSFVNDVAAHFGRIVNEQSHDYASGEDVDYPIVSSEGGKEALLANFVPFTMGSDHQIYAEGSFRIPVIYLNDWPDRYIHTHKDSPANIDPTKLARAAFIAAASGYYLSRLDGGERDVLWAELSSASLVRSGELLRDVATAERAGDLSQAQALRSFHLWREEATMYSVSRFFALDESWAARSRAHGETIASLVGIAASPRDPSPGAELVYARSARPVGPMAVFGYDYLEGHLAADRHSTLGLLAKGGLHEYEALNLIDGRRSVGEVAILLSAIAGPVTVDELGEYYEALAEIDVLKRSR
ncbi:MAG TPA: DUF4910 domain-containing protein [Candidatus Krumholzibacteria bacterium]|jgi:hypothetical protein